MSIYVHALRFVICIIIQTTFTAQRSGNKRKWNCNHTQTLDICSYVEFSYVCYQPCQPSFISHCLMYQLLQAAMLRSLRRPVLSHISIVDTVRGTIYQYPPQTRGLMQHAGSTLSPLSPNKLHGMCLLNGCSFMARLWAADKAMTDEGLWPGLVAHVPESSEWVRSKIWLWSRHVFFHMLPLISSYTIHIAASQIQLSRSARKHFWQPTCSCPVTDLNNSPHGKKELSINA